ncbi:MAG: hypothetical protein QOC99_2224 [Acidobacteriota bacterium]|jgi:hypothetical protein|nr:hypothetical protein [Acidobacteriota bacterium]
MAKGKLLLVISLLCVWFISANAQKTTRLTDEDVARERHIKVEQVRELKADLGTTNEALSQLSEQELRQ